MRYMPWFLFGTIALLLIFSSCGEATEPTAEQSSPQDSAITIEIKNIQFTPAVLTIDEGTTIRWLNLDPVDHDVTSGISITGRKARGMTQTKFPDGLFASGLFGQNESFSYTFKEKGEYAYYCNIHPFMVAKILVK